MSTESESLGLLYLHNDLRSLTSLKGDTVILNSLSLYAEEVSCVTNLFDHNCRKI